MASVSRPRSNAIASTRRRQTRMVEPMHIKKDDIVEVIAGDDAAVGQGRRVLRAIPSEGKVVDNHFAVLYLPE